ncbi:PEP-CTERM sorting domain-containing protein [Almyronema epifaneia]|uniref:PEP-CTERM sorting domain-containing protein n=1 Tax=Almyronema epifaneia S1 TaxID=2991925 RepID=A0ABW6IB77_9CYAN
MKKHLLVALASLSTAFGTAIPTEAANVNLTSFNSESWSYTVDFDEPDLASATGLTYDNLTFEYTGIENVAQYLSVTSLVGDQALKIDTRAGYDNVLTTDNGANNASIRFDFLQDENGAKIAVGQRLKRLKLLEINNSESYIKIFLSELGLQENTENPIGEAIAGDSTARLIRLGAAADQDLDIGYEVTSFEVYLDNGGAIAEVEFVPEPLTLLGSGVALTLGILLRRKRNSEAAEA